MTDYIISSKLSNETVYAYYRGRFWRWDGSIWKESHLMTQKFERAKAADKKLTPQEFLTNGAEFAPLDEYEIDCAMLDALKNAKPCKNAPIEPMEEHPTPSVQCSDAATAGEAKLRHPRQHRRGQALRRNWRLLPTHPVFRSVQTKTRLCPRVPRPPLTLVQTTRQTPCFCRMRRPSSPAIWPALWPQSTPTI